MIITCKGCNASFNLDESLLKPEGSKVRCSKCKEIFVAYPPVLPKEAEKPDEIISDLEFEQETEDFETGQLDDSGSGELDLPDMDMLFSEEEIPEKEGDADETIEDFELGLDLEPEPEKPSEDVAAEAKLDEPDKLDLSEMEELLDDTQVPEKEGDADEAIEDFELDLDLEPEPEKPSEDVAAEAKLDEPDKLDLSEMEELLDDTQVPEKEGDADEAIEDFELDLDLEPEPEKPSEDVEAEAKLDEPDELDLSDIEELIDLEDPVTDEKDEAEPEEIELELDTEIEPEIEKAPEDIEASVEPEELEEVDLSDIEKMFEAEEGETEEEVEPVDSILPEATLGSELDEIEAMADKPEPVDFSEPEEIDQEFAIEDTDQDDLSEEGIDHVQPAVGKAMPAMKKRISKPLIVLLIFVLLGGGCYSVYVLLDFMNIKIPFVSDYFKPPISDPAGNLKIDTLDIDSAFVKNVKAGKLFMITGKIKNGYSDARSYIRVTGKLYKKGKNLVQKETIFCGNILSDIELSNLELSAIKKRLSHRLGDNNSNIRVKPGQELPFMIVFGNLPADLEEFAIEAEGSAPG
jgi:pilus assembly protein FimV